MLYNKIGTSGMYVSRVCLGTMAFGSLIDEKESFRIMDVALDNGITFFDTANGYGRRVNKLTGESTGSPGLSEEIIGRWFAQGGGRREKIVLITKFNSPGGELHGANNRPGLSAWKIRRSLDDSLRRLQTDHLEIFMMHRVDRSVSWAELWPAFTAAQFQGKLDYVASSAFAAHDLVTAQAEAEKRGLLGLICDQHRYNLVCRVPELEVIPALEKLGMGLLPYSPLGGGHLSGKALDAPGPRTQGRVLTEEQRAQLEAFQAFSEEVGISQPKLAHAWILKNPAVSAFLTGPRTVEMLEEAIASVDVELTDDMMAKLDEIFPGPGGPATDAYNW
ncbi:aldo/keto reductase [Eubacteriales bacterium OttesenSCG-928-M02]|nr:aldo/keto reductase [Eubacteriales bacterium OttesenSCG-928-M02]